MILSYLISVLFRGLLLRCVRSRVSVTLGLLFPIVEIQPTLNINPSES